MAIFNRIFVTEERRVGRNDLAKFLAKKIKRNIEVKNGLITVDSMTDLFVELRQSLRPQLEVIEKDRAELRQKAVKIGATEYIKAMHAEYDKREHQLIEEATDNLLRNYQVDPSVYTNSLKEIDSKLMIELLERQGEQVHPVHKSKDILFEVLQAMKDAEEQKLLEEPDAPPALVRAHSLEVAKQNFNLEEKEIQAAYIHHKADADERFNKFNELFPQEKKVAMGNWIVGMMKAKKTN
mmetsp:Transcript_14064/g.26326  ORF Transcript_14064/g.26326 Transcript_14064/m.26326 type:complete len:238 (+) Transcript_14064:115-828(+)